MQPKIQYLRLLAENIMAYDEQAPEEASTNEKTTMPSNIENLSITQLIGLLKPAQFKSVLAVTIAVIVAVFYFGYEVNSWKHDKDKYNLILENNKLKDENKQIKNELSSLIANKKNNKEE